MQDTLFPPTSSHRMEIPMHAHQMTFGDVPIAAQLNSPPEEANPAKELSDMVKASFAESLRRIIARTVGQGPAADQALEDGGFLINDRMVVVRLNPDTDFVELFCDIGQPDPHYLESVYRAALEANLCRKFPGLTLGVHPESGRLVGTLAVDGLMFDDEELCMTILETLTCGAWHVRESGLFRFED